MGHVLYTDPVFSPSLDPDLVFDIAWIQLGLLSVNCMVWVAWRFVEQREKPQGGVHSTAPPPPWFRGLILCTGLRTNCAGVMVEASAATITDIQINDDIPVPSFRRYYNRLCHTYIFLYIFVFVRFFYVIFSSNCTIGKALFLQTIEKTYKCWLQRCNLETLNVIFLMLRQILFTLKEYCSKISSKEVHSNQEDSLNILFKYFLFITL